MTSSGVSSHLKEAKCYELGSPVYRQGHPTSMLAVATYQSRVPCKLLANVDMMCWSPTLLQLMSRKYGAHLGMALCCISRVNLPRPDISTSSSDLLVMLRSSSSIAECAVLLDIASRPLKFELQPTQTCAQAAFWLEILFGLSPMRRSVQHQVYASRREWNKDISVDCWFQLSLPAAAIGGHGTAGLLDWPCPGSRS